MLVATHEQAGAQVYLERVSPGPDFIATRYVDAHVAGETLEITENMPAGPTVNNHVISAPILSFDPVGLGPPTSPERRTRCRHDVDRRRGGPGADRRDELTARLLELDPGGSWTAAAIPPTLTASGTDASSWTDWAERMNYIPRLFEQNHTNIRLFDTDNIDFTLEEIVRLDDAATPRMTLRAVLGIVLLVALGACGDDSGGRPDPSDEPRDDVISATLDGLWQATGVDVSQVSISDYRYRFEPSAVECAELDTDDQWLAMRTSSSPPGLGEQAALESSISEFLEGEGFAVEHLRRTSRRDDPRVECRQ